MWQGDRKQWRLLGMQLKSQSSVYSYVLLIITHSSLFYNEQSMLNLFLDKDIMQSDEWAADMLGIKEELLTLLQKNLLSDAIVHFPSPWFC